MTEAHVVLEIIDASGAITSLTGEEKIRALHYCLSYLGGRGGRARGIDGDDTKAQWHFELSVLAALDRVLFEASPPSANCSTQRPLLSKLDLPDALLASISSRLNAAYVLPQFVFAHELFTAGAWLGLLMYGTRCASSAGIATVFADIFGQSLSPDGISENDVLADLLVFQARKAIDASTLLEISRCVVAAGSSVLVRAGVHQDTRSRPYPIWNSNLHELVEVYLQKSISGRHNA